MNNSTTQTTDTKVANLESLLERVRNIIPYTAEQYLENLEKIGLIEEEIKRLTKGDEMNAQTRFQKENSYPVIVLGFFLDDDGNDVDIEATLFHSEDYGWSFAHGIDSELHFEHDDVEYTFIDAQSPDMAYSTSYLC